MVPMKRLTCCVVMCIALSGGLRAQESGVPARLSLEEALRLAEQRNPVIAGASAEVAIAEAGAVAARARPNPAFSLSSEGFPLRETSRPSFLNDQELVVRLEQDVELGGRRRLRVDGAQAGVGVAKASLKECLRRVRLQVRRGYFQVVLAKADLDVSAATLEEIDKVIAINRSRFEAGEISGMELRRLQVERLRFADDRFATELALRHDRSALLAMLNVTPLDQPFETIDALSQVPAAADPRRDPVAAAALRGMAVSGRPDLQAARTELDRAQSDIALQHALRTPNVRLGAGYRRDFGQGGLVFDVTVPLPIFDRNQGGTARAAAYQSLASARVAQAEAAVSLEVQQALDASAVSRARVDYVEREYLKAAREARDIVLGSYRAGAASLIDYLDAQRGFRDALRTFNRALYDDRIARFELEAAVGAPVPADSGVR
jgi:cobalt-zinc-cadmium efflux system outer membrane protein